MSDWSKTALLFPGQGSQVVGMGADFAATYPAAREVFQQADDLLEMYLSELCFQGPEEALNDTLNTQPALYVCSIAILRALQTELPDAHPICVSGHSLGEFSALTAAGALPFADGLRLVRERARIMKEAGEANPGGMAALLGLDADKVREICQQAQAQTGGVLVLANDNCPGQIVISGEHAALDVGLELAKAAGAKRAVKLAVSVAAHSPLMASAEWKAHIEKTPFEAPSIPIYGNVSASLLKNVEAIRDELIRQLMQNVRWTESIQAMITAGATHFLEIGSKDVLTGLLKRIDRSVMGTALNTVEAFHSYLDQARAS